LNVDFGINNERQDCNIGTVCLWEGRVKGGDEYEGKGSMNSTYIKETE
jgi:hypothetical protein